MATYMELRGQIEALQKEADAVKAKERKEVIARMKEAISAFEIDAAELGFASPGRRGKPVRAAKRAGPAAKKPRAKSSASSGVAYADGAGNTWGGRGKRPRWLKEALDGGAQLEQFRKDRAG